MLREHALNCKHLSPEGGDACCHGFAGLRHRAVKVGGASCRQGCGFLVLSRQLYDVMETPSTIH